VLRRGNSEVLYLLIDGSSVLAAVDVPQVQWVTGEDDVVSTDGPLDEVGGLLADNLPEKITRDVVDFGHCYCLVGVFWWKIESEFREIAAGVVKLTLCSWAYSQKLGKGGFGGACR